MKNITMTNYHFERWIYKTVVGFILISGGIFFMYYSITHNVRDNWILYGLVSAIACGLGAYFLGSASVNKVKSDIIKKQKMKQQSG